MVNHDSYTPKYVQIKEYILQSIQSGAYPHNSRIPSTRTLADQFEVNRLTVTKAIDELVQEGWLATSVGKGTFVAPAKIDQELLSLTSFTEDVRARGQKPSSLTLLALTQPVDRETASLLQLPTGAEVHILSRVRLADNKPIAIETSTLNAAVCPRLLEKHDFSKTSLYEVLWKDYGLTMAYAHQTLEAREPTSSECEALHITAHMPVLAVTRITYSGSDQPVEYVRSAYRGDRYKFKALLRKV